MKLYNQAALGASDPPDVALDILAGAANGRIVGAERRVVAGPDRFNPDEGLALLEAYVGIPDAAVRQAVLDIVMAIAATGPYRRAHTSVTKGERRGLGRPFGQDI